MRNLKVVMIKLQDFLCVSHTLSKFGEHVELGTLSEFMTHWLGLVQHHPSAKRLWSEATGGQAMAGYSTIRWCSREVVQNELAVKLGTHVSDFVDQLIDREIGEAHPRKMRSILDSKMEVLQNELAVSLDMQRVISVVHRLEGDGLVVLLAYDEIDALITFGDTVGDTPHTLPNLARLLRDRKKLAKDVRCMNTSRALDGLTARSPAVTLQMISTVSSIPMAEASLNLNWKCASGWTFEATQSGRVLLPKSRRASITSEVDSMAPVTTLTMTAVRCGRYCGLSRPLTLPLPVGISQTP